MKKHTNFEIEGRYYNEDELGVGFYIASIVLGISVITAILELTGLTDNFISWIG